MPAERQHQTVVADPGWLGPAFLTCLPTLGAAAGWGLNLAAGWITGLGWFPFRGLIERFTDLPDAARLAVALGLGATAGLVLGFIAVHELLTVTVDRHRLRIERGDYKRTVDSADIASVFVADKRLVVIGRRRQELARVEFDLNRDRVAEALRRHGYPALAGADPYEREYRRWVPGGDGLPKGADALLKARQYAIENGKKDDAEELRGELAKLDVVVRAKDKKQYWRPSDPR